jgi:hypothetical protein
MIWTPTFGFTVRRSGASASCSKENSLGRAMNSCHMTTLRRMMRAGFPAPKDADWTYPRHGALPG